MGPVTRVVQTGIGLAAELKAAKKERKAAAAAEEDSESKVSNRACKVAKWHIAKQQIL